MRPFLFERAWTAREAAETAGHGEVPAQDTAFIGGGTTLLDLMKLGIMRPRRLIDITGLKGAEADGRLKGRHLASILRNSPSDSTSPGWRDRDTRPHSPPPVPHAPATGR